MVMLVYYDGQWITRCIRLIAVQPCFLDHTSALWMNHDLPETTQKCDAVFNAATPLLAPGYPRDAMPPHIAD